MASGGVSWMTPPNGNLEHVGALTSFVGRRSAGAQVKELLGSARHITLTGPGGVGKTRLALHVGQSLQRIFTDGVWLIELAELRDPDMIGHAVIDALSLYDQSQSSPEEVLVNSLRNRKALLIFDNCEHVLHTAASLMAAILRGAPQVRVLATSREPLNVPGEYVYAVLPLSVPDSSSVTPEGLVHGNPFEYEAVELFAKRAAASCPGFELGPHNRSAVTRICMRLEGIPLAIELAAVRLRALGVDQVLGQLEDHFRALPTVMRGAPLRHQTLRATVEWSYALCSTDEQAVWARLSPFTGGFELDAAMRVCGDDTIPTETVVECVAALVDKSILTHDTGSGGDRYRMLETIRQYGHEILRSGSKELEIRRRHCRYYVELADRAAQCWSGLDQLKWLAMLRRELPNLRQALDAAFTELSDEQAGVHTAMALRFLWVCGASLEGRYWIDRALSTTEEGTSEWIDLLWISGWVKLVQGALGDSEADLGRALSWAEQLDDDEARHHAQEFLGIVKLLRNQLDCSDRLLTRALARYHEGRPWDATALLGLAAHGWTKLVLGQERAAEETADTCRQIGDQLGEWWAYSWALWVLGLLRRARGERAAATEAFGESIRAKRRLDDWFGIPNALEMLVWNSIDDGDYVRAVRLLAGTDRLWEPIGAPIFGFQPYLETHDHYVARLRAELGDSRFQEIYRQGAAVRRDRLVADALGEEVSVPQRTARSPLTYREQQVAELVGRGLSNKAIAQELVLSVRTAESHVENVLKKLGFTTRSQVAAWLHEVVEPVEDGAPP